MNRFSKSLCAAIPRALGLLLSAGLLSACGPASTDAPTAAAAPAADLPYEPVTADVCATIQEIASQTLGTSLDRVASAPFIDPATGTTGQGCTLTASGTGADFGDPTEVVSTLAEAMVGWEEQPAYQASGPTGAATGLTRDMGLLLVRAEWEPAAGASCPSDRPISACDLAPDQRQYTIELQAAQQ